MGPKIYTTSEYNFEWIHSGEKEKWLVSFSCNDFEILQKRDLLSVC